MKIKKFTDLLLVVILGISPIFIGIHEKDCPVFSLEMVPAFHRIGRPSPVFHIPLNGEFDTDDECAICTTGRLQKFVGTIAHGSGVLT